MLTTGWFLADPIISADTVALLQRHRRAQTEQRLALGLGHTTVGLTLDTYSHVLPDLQREAAEVMDGVLRPALRRSATGPPRILVGNWSANRRLLAPSRLAKGRFQIQKVEPGEGLEPPTRALRKRCSTTELSRPLSMIGLP